MPNKKISQFPLLSNPTNDVVFAAVASGTNYTVAFSSFTTDIPSIDVLGTRLSGFTNGIRQEISSGDTILSAFENLQVSKQDLLNVVTSGDPQSSSFIEIDPSTANVNIVAVSSAQTEINISTETSGATDNIILNDDGLIIESELNGNTASIILSEGFGISYTGSGIFNDVNGFYIKNPDKIYFPISTITGDTLAKLSDLSNFGSKHWESNVEKTIESDTTLVISGNYVLSGTNLTLNSDNLNLNISGIDFNKYAQIFIGGHLLLIDSNIINNGMISVGGGIIMSGTSTITGTGILI